MKYKILAGVFMLAILISLAGCFPGLVSGDSGTAQPVESVDVP